MVMYDYITVVVLNELFFTKLTVPKPVSMNLLHIVQNN